MWLLLLKVEWRLWCYLYKSPWGEVGKSEAKTEEVKRYQ